MTRPSSLHTSAPLVQPPGFGQLIKEGIGFGAGQAIAHRAINAVLGASAPSQPLPSQVLPSEPKTPCLSERNLFESCLKIRGHDNQCDNEQLAYTHCIQLNEKSS